MSHSKRIQVIKKDIDVNRTLLRGQQEHDVLVARRLQERHNAQAIAGAQTWCEYIAAGRN